MFLIIVTYQSKTVIMQNRIEVANVLTFIDKNIAWVKVNFTSAEKLSLKLHSVLLLYPNDF